MPSPSSSSASSFSLVARDLAREHGPHTVLDRVDVSIGPRTRLGVVGPNGVGKSTLLRILAGQERPDRGSITATPPTLRVGHLAQEPERFDETVLEFLARRTGVTAAEAELERAAAALADGTDAAADAYTDALDAYLAVGGPDLDARARAMCDDLGLPVRLLDASMRVLSGGEAARASLAAILLSRFDVLLLDEPTNDLDFAGLERLESFVDELPGGVVIVSHDRAFLERAVTRVLELDEHTRSGTEYGGGWLGYLDARATARRHAEEDFASYRTERGRLEQRARTQREWSVQGTRAAKKDTSEKDKNIRHFKVATSEKQAAKARQTREAIDRLEVVEKPWEGWDLRFQVASAPRSSDVVMRLRGAVVQRGAFTLGPVDLEIGWRDRVALGGAERLGQDDAAPRVARSTPARRGRAVDGRERRAGGDGPGPGRVHRRPAAARGVPRRHRPDPRRRPIAPGQVRSRAPITSRAARRRSRRGSAPAPSSLASRPRASTAWCSTSRPTTSTSRPSSSSSRPSRATTARCWW